MNDDQVMFTEEQGDFKLQIIQDDCINSGPDEWEDKNLLLVHYHRDCEITRDEILTENEVRDWYQTQNSNMVEYDPENDHCKLAALLEDYWIFPVSAYIHSGVVLSLGRGGQFPDQQWDVSHVGVVLAAKSEWPEEDKAWTVAEGLVESWNDYLSGNIYGWVVTKQIKCDSCGDTEEEYLDACWGYYGDWDAKDSYILQEGRAALQSHVEKELACV